MGRVVLEKVFAVLLTLLSRVYAVKTANGRECTRMGKVNRECTRMPANGEGHPTLPQPTGG
jgi:hypothetical protein